MKADWEGWAEELRQALERLGASMQDSALPCARLPVSGGVFHHPLTREVVEAFVLYGAGPMMVKIVSPRFLWSLPRLKLAAERPEQFFAAVAKHLGEVLLGLGRTRSQLLAIGITGELEADQLLLRAKTQLATRETLLAADANGRVTLERIDGNCLATLERSARSVVLGPEPATNLEALGSLAARLFAKAASGEEAPVLELTEVIDDPSRQSAPPSSAAGEATVSLGEFSLGELLDKFGSRARIAAVGGRLRIETTLKVVQGVYAFRLEQQGPARFAGLLLTPTGQRRLVAFDLAEVNDLQEVLDRYLMGH